MDESLNKLDELSALIAVFVDEDSVMTEDEINALGNEILEISREVVDMYQKGQITVVQNTKDRVLN